MLPNITVDDARCTDPMACFKCIQACPTHVLSLTPGAPPQKFMETPSQQYKLRGVRFNKCTACGDCVSACPQQAIQVTCNGG